MLDAKVPGFARAVQVKLAALGAVGAPGLPCEPLAESRCRVVPGCPGGPMEVAPPARPVGQPPGASSARTCPMEKCTGRVGEMGWRRCCASYGKRQRDLIVDALSAIAQTAVAGLVTWRSEFYLLNR